MPTRGLDKVLEHLRHADGDSHRDGQLLARFLDGHDEAAFAALVRQHGPMVLGVCRRLLGNIHDAEDAFQATFLVLARKAASVVKREAVASWLYAVAYRTAQEAKLKASKRRARERQVEEMPHPEVTPSEAQDWRPLLDWELNQLPEKYRAPLVLCELEGKTRREAARQLALSEGTLSSRLARARRMLAKRLAMRGVSLSGGALAAAMSAEVTAAVPAMLARATVKAATLVAAGQAAAVATPAVALMNEVLKAMLMTKLKVAVALVMAVALLGGGGLVYRAAGEDLPVAKRAGDKALTEVEVLHREVEILKLQMEVLQEKVRTQADELRSLRGRVGAAPAGMGHATPRVAGKGQPGQIGPVPAPITTPDDVAPATPEVPQPRAVYPVAPGGVLAPAPQNTPMPAPGAPAGDLAPATPEVPHSRPAYPVAPGGFGVPAPHNSPVPDLVQEVEAAVKALRQAGTDPARQLAMDKLEKAMHKLREQSRKERSGTGQ